MLLFLGRGKTRSVNRHDPVARASAENFSGGEGANGKKDRK